MRVEEVVRRVLAVVETNIRGAKGMCVSFRPGEVKVKNSLLLHGVLERMVVAGLLRKLNTSKGNLYLVCRDSPLWKIVENGGQDVVRAIAGVC